MKRWRGWWLLVGILIALLMGWLMLGGGNTPTSPAASKVTAAMLRDPGLIARGEYLTLVGDCAGCHTTQGGARFAGGRSLATPFGNIPVPNITPDRETGLGDWSFEDFW
jgi:mono/diheme cytochrome c family protein